MKVTIPQDLKGKALFKYLVANKQMLIAQKKASIKYTDPLVSLPTVFNATKVAGAKAAGGGEQPEDNGIVKVKVVGNSAWWCDSQMDVLTDSCYDKSIKERGILIPHIADHIHKSTNHVGDVTAVYTQKIALKALGLDMAGTTTCFCMETDVRQDYNEDTYKFYKNRKINQHSIGLQYLSIGMCINDEEYLPEFELWNKYYDKVINKELIDERGYFWIVPEIRILENSCVLFGANELTPTLQVTDTADQPSDDTEGQPSKSNNKSVVICPNCSKSFSAPAGGGPANCPDCGQYVSMSSTTTEIATFDVLAATAETKFFN